MEVSSQPPASLLEGFESQFLEEPSDVNIISNLSSGLDIEPQGDNVIVHTKTETNKHPETRQDRTQEDQIEVNLSTNKYKNTENTAAMKMKDFKNVDNKSTRSTVKYTEFKLPDTNETDSGKGDDESEKQNRVIDIVKQSKLNTKHATSEYGEFSEFLQSRPLTETSLRDGAKTATDSERKGNTSKMDTERSDNKTQLSVKVDRKPLHTAHSRSHSDYFSKSQSTNRYTHRAVSLGQFYGISPDSQGKENRFLLQLKHIRRPPKLVRLATVTMSPKIKLVPRGPSLYYEEPKKPKKVITWDEAMESRPPLRIDMEGPGPTQYSLQNKSLNETSAPSWTFGSKCTLEKVGGSRTSWEKTWFQTPEVWTSKVDFNSDSAWPTPTHYRLKPTLGPRQRTVFEAPSFTIGTRKELNQTKTGNDKEPSPVDYDKNVADKLVLKNAPSFSHQFRREGTVIWASKEKVPGPGTYSPNYSYNKTHGPVFSIRSLRREKSHVLGPFSTF